MFSSQHFELSLYFEERMKLETVFTTNSEFIYKFKLKHTPPFDKDPSNL